jgi:hypothetical protein
VKSSVNDDDRGGALTRANQMRCFSDSFWWAFVTFTHCSCCPTSYSPVCSQRQSHLAFCSTYTCLFDLAKQQRVHTTQTLSTFATRRQSTPHLTNKTPLHTHDNMSSRGRGAGKFKAKRGGKHDPNLPVQSQIAQD